MLFSEMDCNVVGCRLRGVLGATSFATTYVLEEVYCLFKLLVEILVDV